MRLFVEYVAKSRSGFARASLLSLALAATVAAPCARAAILSSKRGFADTGASYGNLQATNAGWYYTWGPGVGNPGAFDANHIPMIWSGTPSAGTLTNIANSDAEWLLGFNEPERGDQANMTVAQAISSWTAISNGLAGSGVKLISPSVADTGGAAGGQQWLASFMSQANSAGLPVDAVAFHWYGVSTPDNPAGAASSFLSRVDSYHNSYGKPVFITEFAIHDWGGAYSDEAIREANRQFLDIVVPALESRSYVAGYAWYHWFGDAPLYTGTSTLTPTTMAHAYVGAVRPGQTENVSGVDLGEHVANLAGGQLAMNGPAGEVKFVNALAGISDLVGTNDWSQQAGGWMRVQPGATLRKRGGNVVTVVGNITNNGVLEASQGRLEVSGAILGKGAVVVSGGTLAMLPGGGVSVAPEIEIRSGGQFDVSPQTGGFVLRNGVTLSVDAGGTVQGDVAVGFGAAVNAAGAFQGNLAAGDGARVRIGGPLSTVVYSDNFSGGATPLNGAAEDARGAQWTANSAFLANGQLDESVEGSALLPFHPVVNAVYELSLDVSNATDRWIGLGFARDHLTSPGFDNLSDRFSNEVEGAAWMLYRDHAANPQQDIELYAGLRTTAQLVDSNAAINFAQANTLRIVIDTTGTGANFTADFQIDQGAGFVSVSGGPKLINLNIDNLNYVGMSYDDATTTPIQLDDFSLVKKPKTLTRTTTVAGNLELQAGVVIELDLFGPGDADRAIVGAALTAAGQLTATLAPGAPAPQLGDSYDLFDFASATGEFASFALPALAPGLAWNTSQLLTTGVLSVVPALTADFDGDGVVDEVDLSAWEAGFGMTTGATRALGDADLDGDVDGADLLLWQQNLAPAATVATARAVPEPAAALLASLMAAVLHAITGRTGWEASINRLPTVRP